MLVRGIGVLTGRGSMAQLQLENAVLRHQVTSSAGPPGARN